MTEKLLAFCSLALLSLAASCSDNGPRVYTARAYDAEAACLGDYEALGLVQAEDLPADCPAVCLDVAGSLYVSTVCPPFPDSAAELDATNESCAVALSAASCE